MHQVTFLLFAACIIAAVYAYPTIADDDNPIQFLEVTNEAAGERFRRSAQQYGGYGDYGRGYNGRGGYGRYDERHRGHGGRGGRGGHGGRHGYGGNRGGHGYGNGGRYYN